MPLVLDHLVYAARDLGRAVDELADRLGVRASVGGSHPGWGTRNQLLALGPDSYLEIIGPDPDQPEPVHPRPFGIDELEGARLVTWAAKAAELDERVERAAAQGVHLGPVRAMSRERPDGALLSWRLTVPRTLPCGGVVPFLIDWGDTPSPALRAPGGCSLIRLSAEHPDPARVRNALAAVDAEFPVLDGPSPRLIAELDTPRGPVTLG